MSIKQRQKENRKRHAHGYTKIETKKHTKKNLAIQTDTQRTMKQTRSGVEKKTTFMRGRRHYTEKLIDTKM